MIQQQSPNIKALESAGSPLVSIPPCDHTPKGRISVLLPTLAFIAANWGDHPAVIEHGREALASVGNTTEVDFDDPTIS